MGNGQDAARQKRYRSAETFALGAVRFLIVLGLYLTLRGYHSLDGDQAYRLPLLLRQQDPSLYASDPFVTAFDHFNPHRGSLVILGCAARLLGLSPALFLIFSLTFLATYCGIDRLAGAVWPQAGRRAGLAAVTLVLIAKAGNIGTNHLFEAMLLDRLMAMALVWLALAWVVGNPDRGWWHAALALGGAALIHPSLGLQASLAVIASWSLWALLGRRTQVGWKTAMSGMLATALALIPGLAFNLGSGGSLLDGLPSADFWVLAVELQSPQHMLPHLWRMPQWLAWASYLVLAGVAFARVPGEWVAPRHSHPPNLTLARGGKHWRPVAQVRLALMLVVVLASLAAAWVAIEVLHNLRITIFQPFRMATVARGLALVLVAGRVVELWERGDWFPRVRSVLIGVALVGDWMLVVVTIAESGAAVCEWLLKGRFAFFRHVEKAVFAGLMGLGLVFLSRHDTESGHWPLMAVLGLGLAVALSIRWATRASRTSSGEREARAERAYMWPRPTPLVAIALAWLIPIAAFCAGLVPADHPAARRPLVQGFVARCRFGATPTDDVERLALWCRRHTLAEARFIGPPGPKTFRLWSQRNLAFNRAGSPYHAAGLADWFRRFQDHVEVYEPPPDFVRDFLAGRHRLEARYDQLSDEEQAALAFRQGAEYVIALSPSARKPVGESSRKCPMELLHTEGRYAVYKVNQELLTHRQR